MPVGTSGNDIYAEVKSWGNWREWEGYTLNATNPIHGGVALEVDHVTGLLHVRMKEQNQSAWIKNDVYVDAYGTPVPLAITQRNFKDENGKFIMSSGWSYEARQLVKKILALAFPESIDEAYQAVLNVMGQKIWEIPSTSLPSAVRWLDGRSFDATLDSNSHTLNIYIGPPDATEYYDEMTAGARKGKTAPYLSANGGPADIPAMYELDRG